MQINGKILFLKMEMKVLFGGPTINALKVKNMDLQGENGCICLISTYM